MTTATDSGFTNIGSIVRGNVGFKTGTWTAAAAGSTTIPSGGTAIIAAGVTMATGASDATAKPVLVSYSASDGNPNLTITSEQTTDSGNYWMIVKLNVSG